MKLAVQTRPWGVERNRTDLNGVLTEVAAAGYDGFEIGNQHLDLSRPHALRAMAEAHGLAIAGIHAGGEISDPAGVRLDYRCAAEARCFGLPADATFRFVDGTAEIVDAKRHEGVSKPMWSRPPGLP